MTVCVKADLTKNINLIFCTRFIIVFFYNTIFKQTFNCINFNASVLNH